MCTPVGKLPSCTHCGSSTIRTDAAVSVYCGECCPTIVPHGMRCGLLDYLFTHCCHNYQRGNERVEGIDEFDMICCRQECHMTTVQFVIMRSNESVY